MKAIINYIVNMLPYILIFTPIYLVVRYIIIKKSKKINWYHEIALFIFASFLVGLFSQTIIPIKNDRIHETNLIPFKIFYETYIEIFKNNNITYFIISFLGNIGMFIPIGFFILLLWNINSKKVIIIGFLISFFIEIVQLFLSRGTDIDDLILNTFGVFLGTLLYKLFNKKLLKFR